MPLLPDSYDKSLRIRVRREEADWFHAIARKQGLTLSDLIRSSLAVEGARLGVPAPVTTT